MSRTVTPPAAQPATSGKISHERIAMRAYEKWMQRGCPHGSDQRDWLEAEAELKAETHHTGGTAAHSTTSARPASASPQPAQAARRR
jgi:hypothetical protein